VRIYPGAYTGRFAQQPERNDILYFRLRRAAPALKEGTTAVQVRVPRPFLSKHYRWTLTPDEQHDFKASPRTLAMRSTPDA